MGDTNPPVILSLSPLDPSGRGGIQANIETTASLGCYCAPIATALCASGDVENTKLNATHSSLIIEQSRSTLEDMPVSAINLGYTGSINNAEALHTVLKDYSSLPVVYQPNLRLWSREEPGEADFPIAISSLLIPATEVLILSIEEAQELTQTYENINATAEELMLKDPTYALISHADSLNHCFQHSLYDEDGLVGSYEWQSSQFRPDDFGPASTLSAAIAGFIAHGSPVKPAIEEALRYTQRSLHAYQQLSFGKPSPNRLFWVDEVRQGSLKTS